MTSKLFLTFVVVCVSVLLGVSEAQVGNCHKIDSCACVYDDGLIVNLTSLSRNDGRPNFSNVTDPHNDLYSWNPCSAFSYPSNDSECQNVAVCMIRQGIPKELFYDLGSQDSADFHVDSNGSLFLTYTADMDGYKRSAVIMLQCMETAKFDYFVVGGEQDEANNTILYTMTLASKSSCAFAPNINPSMPVSGGTVGLGAGIVVLIVLLSLIGSYVIFGALFQGLVKHERGARLCPNHEFWCNIPSLAKNGCKKTDEPMAQTTGTPKYESI